MDYYNYFFENPIQKVKVSNGSTPSIEYDCIKGIETVGCFYKNGYKVTVREGKGKHKYIQLDIYTSCNQQIDIEERWLIRNDNKICRRTGWNNVNLLSMAMKGENERDLNYWIKK
jgi:hypothetical protein